MSKRTTKRLLVNWRELEELHPVERCAHHWVSDESIRQAIQNLEFDDPRVPHDDCTRRNRRIAAIVVMQDAGVEFPPLYLKVTKRKVEIHDGHHRLRALQYRNRLDAVVADVYGQLQYLAPAVVSC